MPERVLSEKGELVLGEKGLKIMRITRFLPALAVAIALTGSLLISCADDTSDLEQRLAAVEAERDRLASDLEEATAELDQVRADPTPDRPSDRYERALANQTAIMDILQSPESYGTEEDIADRLGELAAPGAQMVDDVFGGVSYRTAFMNTLFSGATDAKIAVYDSWLSNDGSQGGFLWVWYGKNSAGNDFELVGISLDDYDEDGLIANEYVSYPYSDSYVQEAFRGAGTALSGDRRP
ncbi:MAG: hypothetical protein OES24_08755 [Acidimicrobiia bacterium]|nr:hypothetical protein [Acidimicrobiia bacterium]